MCSAVYTNVFLSQLFKWKAFKEDRLQTDQTGEVLQALTSLELFIHINYT